MAFRQLLTTVIDFLRPGHPVQPSPGAYVPLLALQPGRSKLSGGATGQQAMVGP